jgi:hypothetical protein
MQCDQQNKTKQNRYSFRLSSTSEDEQEEINNKIQWQQVRSSKRKKVKRVQEITVNNNAVEINNRFNPLTVEETSNQKQETTSTKLSRPPPIYVYGVINYPNMISQIRELLEDEQYNTKSLINNTVKLNCTTPDSYRKLVRHFKQENIVHHTYQLKEERAYRIVIKHMHHTINTQEIAAELTQLGHRVRNIINVKHRTTKEPLNTFFVDLEPAANNKEIYNIETLQNIRIKIEPPHRGKNNIVQCMRCQQYGHSRSYCNRPYVCVKCGGSHSTNSCKKSKDTPATCALCGGSHTANYKGCEYYQTLVQRHTVHTTSDRKPFITNETPNTHPPTSANISEVTPM